MPNFVPPDNAPPLTSGRLRVLLAMLDGEQTNTQIGSKIYVTPKQINKRLNEMLLCGYVEVSKRQQGPWVWQLTDLGRAAVDDELAS